jgi:hypothetical protein
MPLLLVRTALEAIVLREGIIGSVAGSLYLVDPELRFLKEIIKKAVILMAVAVHEHINPAAQNQVLQQGLVGARINDSLSLVVNEKRVTVGISRSIFPGDERDATEFSNIHDTNQPLLPFRTKRRRGCPYFFRI